MNVNFGRDLLHREVVEVDKHDDRGDCQKESRLKELRAVWLSWWSLRRSTVMFVPGTWSVGELDELIEEVLVDAYGDSEQLGAFECVFVEAGLPAAATAIGMACSLDEVEFDGDERRGLVAVITLDGRRQRLSLVDIEITDESHEAARLLAAFRRWWIPPR